MTVTATVTVTLEIEVLDVWSDDATVGQVKNQALASAETELRKALINTNATRKGELVCTGINYMSDSQ